MRVVVRATNPDASIVEASQPTTLVQDAGPLNQSLPVVTGAAQRGGTLNATAGTWSGIGNTYAFQWQASSDGVDLGQPGRRDQLELRADRQRRGQAACASVVTATNADGSQSAASAATAAVAGTAVRSTPSAPTVNGTAQRGSTLTSTPGTWTGIGNVYSYQWQRDGGSGFDRHHGRDRHHLHAGRRRRGRAAAPRGHRHQPGRDRDRRPATRRSPVASAPPVNTVAPVLSGTPQRGSTLSVSQGTWSGVGNTYAYQWQTSTDGTTWTNVAGATDAELPARRLRRGQAGARARHRDQRRRHRHRGQRRHPRGPERAAGQHRRARSSAAPPQRASMLTTTLGHLERHRQHLRLPVAARHAAPASPNIAGATGASYTLAVADEYASCACRSRPPTPTAPPARPATRRRTVPAAPPANTGRPAITGTARARHRRSPPRRARWNGVGNAYTLPVAARQRLGLRRHHRRDRLDLHAGRRRRGRQGAPEVDRDQPGRHARPPQRPDRDRRRRAAASTPSRPTITGNAQRAATADRDQRHLERDRQHLHVPVAALDRQRHDLDRTSTARPPSPTRWRSPMWARSVRLLVTVTNPDATVSAASAATATVGAPGPGQHASARPSPAPRSAARR